MSVETDIIAHLSTFAGLAALVSTRIYTDVRPQNAVLPHVVVLRVATPRVQAFGAGSPVLASEPLFQCSVWAETASARASIGDQLRLALTDFATNHAATCIFADERNSRDEDTGYWRRDIDARILHAGA